MMAPLSELVIVTLVVAVLTIFQFASTALTRMPVMIGDCAVWEFGVPILPVEVPGAAVSPGAKICNFVTAPAVTVTDGLVLAVRFVAASVAVMVRVPAVLNVKLERTF